MFQLDDDFLKTVGLSSLPDAQRQEFLDYLYDELELRVGTRLSEGMSEAMLAEFEKHIDDDDEQAAVKWLETNRPDYKQIVTEELEKMRQEVIANKDKILAAGTAS